MNWKSECQTCARSKSVGAGFVLPCDLDKCSYEPYQSTTVPHLLSLNQVTTGCGNCGYICNGMCTKAEKCYGTPYPNTGKQSSFYEGATGKAAPIGDPIGIVDEKTDEKKSPYINSLEKTDPEVATAVKVEEQRQRDNLELIASENIVSPAVMAAVGSCLTNKYAEGYPGKRYYGGCENVDTIEQLAIDRAKELFGAEHANVQPHCGTTANLAVYAALCQPGDTILAMSLDAGGHLSHGFPITMSGKLYHFVHYGLGNDGYIDYDEVLRLALEHQPKLIVAGASAYPREIDFAKFKEIANAVNAYLMVDMAHIAGLVAAGQHMSPVPYADVVTTTTHKTLRGPRGGLILCTEELAKAIDKAVFPANQGGPLEHIIAGKAVMLKEAMTPEFIDYQEQVVRNAKAMANIFRQRGVKMVSGGTDNHLILLDLRDKHITGKELETLLEQANITVNKNAVPNDPLPASKTSGVRIGTPTITTRGMGTTEAGAIAHLIADVIEQGERAIPRVKEEVKELCRKFPITQF